MTENSKSQNYLESGETTSVFSSWLTSLTFYLFSYIVLPFYFKIKIRGQENIPRTNATILAPTHRSRWDPIIVSCTTGWLSTKRPLRYMVSEEQTRGFQGWFIRHLGGFPVDRNNPGISSIRYSIEILKNQEMLVLFPEGKIYPENQSIYSIQPGVSRIALQAISGQSELDLKIVPISILYDHPAPPPWRCGVQVNIGSPIDVQDYLGYSTKQAAKELTANLALSLKQLHQKS